MRGHYSTHGQIDMGPIQAAFAGLVWALHSIVGWASTGSYNIPLHRLGKALYKETYGKFIKLCPLQMVNLSKSV